MNWLGQKKYYLWDEQQGEAGAIMLRRLLTQFQFTRIDSRKVEMLRM